MFIEWSWFVGLFIGAAIGSFLNVVIYRMPRSISLAKPEHSFCPTCKHRLGALDLFPLFSWLALRGKCRHCRAPISSRYFFVELLTGSIWAGIWWQYLVHGWEPARAIAYMLASAGLVAIIFIDWELYIIPDEINAWLLLVGIGYHLFTHTIDQALFGALLGWALLWGIAMLGRILFRKDAMGHGDIKMMRGMGAVLGPLLLGVTVTIAVFLGAILGMLLILFTLSKRQPTSPAGTGGESLDSGSSDGDRQAAVPEPETELPPESIKSLLVCGLLYLVGFDILALFVPKLNSWLEGELPEMAEEDDENWKPSLTTIPFGPYLAAGAIICMLAAPSISASVRAYWDNATNPKAAQAESLRIVASLGKSAR